MKITANIDINTKQWEQFKKCDYPNFVTYIKDFAPVFSPIVKSYLKNSRLYFEDTKHKDIDKYLYNPLIEYTENPGKLHRPLTCLAAYLACNKGDVSRVDNVYPVASSIEHFQSAALIHDDIADDGQLRRGKPCMHKTLGTGLAINVGDYGLSMVVGSVVQAAQTSSLDEKTVLAIIEELVKMEYATIEGQAMDLGWAKDDRFDISADDYLEMAKKKTSFYSAAVPCVLGAICAGANGKIVEALRNFGICVGLAFQIQDDILNLVEGDDNAKKKDFRSDITEGKRTLVVVKALELANTKDAKKLKMILQSNTNNEDELARAVEIMKNSKAIDYAIGYASKLSDKAKSYLSVLEDSKWKDLLIDMANWAKQRKS